MRKRILPILLTLCLLVLLVPTTVLAEPQAEVKTVCGKLEVFGMKDGQWSSLGKLTFPKTVETQTLEINENITALKVVKLEGYEVNLDELTLEGACPTGYERKLKSTDKDLIEVVDETIFELQGSGTLTISARAPLTLLGEDYAFKFPESNLYHKVTPDSEFYTYTLGSNNDTFSAGDTVSVPNTSNLFYNEMAYPGSGHPSAPVQIYLADDGINLYAFFEAFIDNTFDHGKDYAAVHIKDGNTVKTYKVHTTDTNEYGKWYFDYTNTDASLDWQHMSYVIEIPLSDLSSPSSDLSVAFEYYGTAGVPALIELGLDGKMFTNADPESDEILLPEPGTYYNSAGGNTPTGEWWLYNDPTNETVPYTLTLNNATLDLPCQSDNNLGLYACGNINIELTKGSINNISNDSLDCGIYSYGLILNISGEATLNIESYYEDSNNLIPLQAYYADLTIKDAKISSKAKYGMRASSLSLINADLSIDSTDGIHLYESAPTMDNSLLTITSVNHAINCTNISTFPEISNALIFTGDNVNTAIAIDSLADEDADANGFQTKKYVKIDNRIFNDATIIGGGTASTGTGFYQKSKTVNISAGTKDGYTFKGWTSNDVTLTDASSKTTSFVMPGKEVKITANWEAEKKDTKAPSIYKITKNDKTTWSIGAKTPLSITCEGDFSKFLGIKVDDVEVSTDNYKAEKGSTIITLSNDYLKTLSAGEHTLGIIYSDGYAEATFTVNKIADTGANDFTTLALTGVIMSAAGYSIIRRKSKDLI